MAVLVFDEPRVPRTTPLRATERKVNWFLKSTRPQAAEGRRVVNDMYSRFPDRSRSLRSRLRSRDDSTHHAALDELLVHELLSRRYRVEYEAATQGTRPDFVLFDGPEHVATVEVYSLMLRGDWQAEQLRHGRIEDTLNRRLRPTTHFIDFEVHHWDDQSDLEHLVGWVAKTLDDLSADPQALPIGSVGLTMKVYGHRSSEVDFNFWPSPDGYIPNDTDRIVTGGPAIGGWVNSALRLRGALKDKAAKYDVGGKPFAIVVGVRDPMCDLDDVLDALVGNQAIVVATGEGTREENGVFGPQAVRGRGMRRPGVSAVFALQDWFPGGPTRHRITRFDNPAAAAPFPVDALPFEGHWGVEERGAMHIRADWLVPPAWSTPADVDV